MSRDVELSRQRMFEAQVALWTAVVLIVIVGVISFVAIRLRGRS